jgi:hypothetical protein
MTVQPLAPARLRHLRTAFVFGSRADDLGKVDARKGGMYNEVAWHVALDGATLGEGLADEYMKHFVNAYSDNGDEAAAEDAAYRITGAMNGLTV